MGMSTHVMGLRDPKGARHRKMMQAAIALNVAGVREMPKEMAEYFGDDYDGDACYVANNEHAGCEVEIEKTAAVEEWSDDCRSGFVVDISKLPDGVTHLRFYNSW